MLYSNVTRVLTDVRCADNSIIQGILLGDCHSNCEHAVLLPTPARRSYRLESGTHHSLAIGRTRTKHPRIVVDDKDPNVYLMLSTRLTANTGSVGELFVPQSQRLNSIMEVHAQGQTQRWSEHVLLAYAGDAFFVKWHRPHSTAKRTAFYYVCKDGEVLACAEGSILSCFRDKKLDVSQLPFSVRENPAAQMHVNSLLDLSEWRLVKG